MSGATPRLLRLARQLQHTTQQPRSAALVSHSPPLHSPSLTSARAFASSSSSNSNPALSSTTTANMSNPLFTDETPASVKDAKGLHLITMSTGNGQKVQIMLEELAELYGTTWTETLIKIQTNEQKKDWFLRLNPNGRIPVIVDHTKSPPFTVHETSAELLYLLKEYDTNDVLGFTDDLERSEALQWLFFWHGSGAPYQGQVNHFVKFAPEKVPYAINRFRNETLRVYGVLELRLSGKYAADGQPRDYLAGKGKGKYSVADIGTWPWVKGYGFAGFTDEEMKEFPHVLKWIDRIAQRPAVKRGTGDRYAFK